MNAPSTAELMLRMAISLVIMGGLLGAVVRMARGRRGRSLLGAVAGARAAQIEVRARRQLSRSASVSLVRVGSRTLLLGIGERGVEVLAEGDDLTAAATGADADADADADAAASGTTTVGSPTTFSASSSPIADPAVTGSTDQGCAGTRARGAAGPGPARIGVMDALRELTVRR